MFQEFKMVDLRATNKIDRSIISRIIEKLNQIIMESELSISDHTVEGLIDVIVREGIIRRCPDLGGVISAESTNFIPSSVKGPCRKALVVVTLERDSLSSRFVNTIYHAGIYCRDINREVLFITTKWDYNEYKYHEKAIRKLQDDGCCRFVFCLLTDTGISKIPL